MKKSFKNFLEHNNKIYTIEHIVEVYDLYIIHNARIATQTVLI